jgi:exosome complex component RRP41
MHQTIIGLEAQKQMEKAVNEAVEEAVEEAAEEAAEVEEAAEEATEEAAEETAEEEASDMAVAKEDIDKAVELYKLIHDAEPKNDKEEDEAKAKVAEKLSEFEWEYEKYEEIQYEITKDPASRTYFQEQIDG